MRSEPKEKFDTVKKMMVQPRPQQKSTVLELCCILAWLVCNAESSAGEQLTGKIRNKDMRDKKVPDNNRRGHWP